MDAIELLSEQHRIAEALLDRFSATQDDFEKRRLFERLADLLTVHSSIEERWFYPTVRALETEERVVHSLATHRDIERILSEALADLETLDSKMVVLRRVVERHVAEEERELFPVVSEIIDETTLTSLGQVMFREIEQLYAEGAPRNRLHGPGLTV